MKTNERKKRRRTAALQNLPGIAQRLGVRLPSGALDPPDGAEFTSRSLRSHKGGFTLIECVAYVALLVIVTGFAMALFRHCWDDNQALRRDADDIVRALRVGDQWRADLRAARGTVQLTDIDGGQQLRIPLSTGDIIYTFSNGELRRQTASLSQVWLAHAESSKMQSDVRQNVTAWRWELELKPGAKAARMRPLFTFEAVAGGAGPR